MFGNEDNFRRFQQALLDEPKTGPVIPGTNGARKIRWADASRGKGKRGGLRIIYYYAEEYATVLLLFAYNKNVPDLTPQQKKWTVERITIFHEELDAEKSAADRP